MIAPLAKSTAADYLAFERGSAERHQFVDGEIFAMAGESLAHSTTNANLIISLGVQLRGKPCRVLSPNMKIRSGLAEAHSTKGLFSYADATVVCGEPRFHDTHQDVLLNPKLIVEVLSPSTEAFDRGRSLHGMPPISTASPIICWYPLPRHDWSILPAKRQAGGFTLPWKAWTGIWIYPVSGAAWHWPIYMNGSFSSRHNPYDEG